MQLKGLVRFFTIVLILISVYQLSFTWFVRGHERKMEGRAKNYVNLNYDPAAKKYPGNKEIQVLYQDTLDQIYKGRLKRLLDSTKDVTITYGPTGAISYEKAKESELNLGLDLQGGINVTLEVELSGLLRSMANNSRDPIFLKALENANIRKANSSANFITLFAEEYSKLNPNGRLASLFAAANPETIKIGDSDDKVLTALRKEANLAFERTFRILNTRIDQFGVAQPNINPNPDRGIITVELPGIQDQERVKKYLQSSANLQFWEVYQLSDNNFAQGVTKSIEDFAAMMSGKKTDTTTKKVDTTTKSQINSKPSSDSNIFSKEVTNTQKADTSNKLPATNNAQASLTNYIQFIPPSQNQQGKISYASALGSVSEKDTALVRSYLESGILKSNFPPDVLWVYGIPNNVDGKKSSRVPLYAIKTYGRTKAKLEGEAISNASQDYDPISSQIQVEMRMNATGTKIWADMTRENVGKPIAIVLDNIVYSAPNVINPIEQGISSISGGFSTPEEAQDLANILKAGKLPAPAKIVQFQQVGPTLGRDAIRGGSMAFLISFIVIFLLMLVYYNTAGWIANIALILNLLFTIGVLTALKATLTAPGIAGLVLTIGMAVDTNVIIYERIKEELTRGKGYLPAIKEGYHRSLPPVLDAHFTVLFTAIILFSFGLGPVKGFATTQIIGILLSLFCGILVSRWVTEWFTNKNRHLEYFTGLSRRIFKHATFKFIEYRKVAYVISFVVLALGISTFFHGFDEGVEFSGGRSFIVRFDKPVNEEQVRQDLKTIFEGESPVIKTIGTNNQLDITTSYLIHDSRPSVDSIVERKILEGLKNYLPPNLSFEKFDSQYKLGTKTVFPTISDDLKRGAKWATFWSLLIITIYIFIRVRDWRYSMGTIVALLHDVFVTLIVFSYFKDLMPFPLEIDQHFIAAILTVIGFSMNDTVIVFDRIREYSRNLHGVTKETVINRAINDTLSRTIMTSLTVFVVILILFLVGGEVTRGFAFAMLVGVVTGTYSSIFVAAPILVDLGRKKPLGKADMIPKEKPKLQTKPVSAK